MYTMENFREDVETARSIVYQAGMHEVDDNHYSLVLKPRMHSLGMCGFRGTNTYEITLNQLYANTASHNEVLITVVHEILHSCKNCLNHRQPWKSACEKVRLYNGMVINTKHSSENIQPYLQAKNQIAMQKNPNKKGYEIECTNCHWKSKKFERRGRSVSTIANNPIGHTNFYCPHCKSKKLKVNEIPWFN